jgi:hypothetical protein
MRVRSNVNTPNPLHPAGTSPTALTMPPIAVAVNGPAVPKGGEALPPEDVAVPGGCEDSPLRSRDRDFSDWLSSASPHYLGYGYSPQTIQPEMSSFPEMVADVSRVQHTLAAEAARPSGRRTVRVFGREMYLPGMAPTAEDDVDLELLEYLWALSRDVGEVPESGPEPSDDMFLD